MKYTTCGHQSTESAPWRSRDYRALRPNEGRPAIPTERHGTILAVWATTSWEGIVVLGQTRVLSLGNWMVDMDAHEWDPQEISCSVEKREQVLETSVLQPPFNSTLFQKGLKAAHRNIMRYLCKKKM